MAPLLATLTSNQILMLKRRSEPNGGQSRSPECVGLLVQERSSQSGSPAFRNTARGEGPRFFCRKILSPE